jgi:hypothetical protein
MDLDLLNAHHAQLCGSLHTEYPLLGLARAHHRNRRGAPIGFLDKPSLIPLYANLPRMERADFCKAVQTGISELFIQLMLYKAGWEDRIVAYVLPTYGISTRFVSERIDPLLSEVPAYIARAPGGEEGSKTSSRGSLSRKRFGKIGSLLFLGSNSESNFVEFTADTMIVDELDECDASNVSKVTDRLRESAAPQLLRVSNPSTPNVGIHKAWKDGSRARYHHACSRCGEYQAFDWLAHFIRRQSDGTWTPRDTERAGNPSLGDLRPVCRRCREPWTPTGRGYWVAEYPDKSPSFHMSRLDILGKGVQIYRQYFAEWVKAQLSSHDLKAFWRGVLGWPYEAAGQRVTDELLELCSEGEPYNEPAPLPEVIKDRNYIMGVDVGSVLNFFVDELEALPDYAGYKRKARYVGAVTDFEDIIKIIELYGVQACVIDAQPETRKAKELRDYFINNGGCSVWLCRFHPQARVGKDAFGLKMEYVEHVVTVDRTQLLDTTMDEFRNNTRRMPSDFATIPGLSEQLKAPSRVFDHEANRFVWREGNDADHYRLADAYSRVAQEIFDRMGGLHEV